jgi:hypothetical protein
MLQGPGVSESILIAMTIGATMIAVVKLLGPIATALGRRLEGSHGTHAVDEELSVLRDRVGEVEGLRERVMELEERVDFAERMIARTPEAGQLPGPERSGR